jgi:hypothetical protein
VAAILVNGKSVAPVDVLVRMGMLAPADLEAWRQGKVPYLERMIHGSLSRLSRLLRILGFHCHDLKLVATPASYTVHGRGPAVSLRFTKTGEARLEKIYARHFVWPGKIPFHPPRPRASGIPEQGRGPPIGPQEGKRNLTTAAARDASAHQRISAGADRTDADHLKK